MELSNVLRAWARDLRQQVPGQAAEYEYCDLPCESCAAERNLRACPLTSDFRLERWAAWHIGRIMADPVLWANEAAEQARSWANPGMVLLFHLLYKTASETKQTELALLRPYLESVLRHWTMNGTLRALIEQGSDAELIEAARELLECANASGMAELRVLPEIVNGVNMTPTVGRPTSEWGRP
jgi:hypothetical protein